MDIQERVAGVVEALKESYPDPRCALEYEKDYELMIAVRLSAQCTDERVNLVTPALFARYPTLESLAQADISEVEGYVRSCGAAHSVPTASATPASDHPRRIPTNACKKCSFRV